MDYCLPLSGQLVTETIQEAINKCHSQGGGTLRFPPGVYLSGTIELKSNVTLLFERGAVLLGSDKIEDYPAKCLIWAENAENIAIEGGGTIDGQGHTFWEGKWYPFTRPQKVIHFVGCKNVTIKDVLVTDAPMFNIQVTKCDLVRIEGVSIKNKWGSPNTDGIDPTSSRNVFISNCYIETGDDAICIKCGDEPTENIVVTNCILKTDDSAIKLGTGSQSRIANCLFSNIVVHGSVHGVAFFMKDGGTFEDIQFSNIILETATDPGAFISKGSYPIFMDIEQRNPDTHDVDADGNTFIVGDEAINAVMDGTGDIPPLGKIKNISFRDITITVSDGNCLIQGHPEQPIEGLTFDNVRIKVKSRMDLSKRLKARGTRSMTKRAINDYADKHAYFTFAHIRNLRMRDIQIIENEQPNVPEYYAIWGEDLKNVLIENLNSDATLFQNSSAVIVK